MGRLVISSELRKKAPQALVDIYPYRYLAQLFGLLFGIFMIWYGPISEHNGYAYILSPVIYPWISALYFILFPKNPYCGMVLGYSTKLNGLDETDEDARRLVDIYRSPGARTFIIVNTLIISVLFVVIAMVFAAIHWHSIVWRLSMQSFGFNQIAFGCLLGSFLYIGIGYSVWGLRLWARGKTRLTDF